MRLPKEKNKIYTYADYIAWPENERIELINGQVYMLTSPSRTHQKDFRAVFLSILRLFKG